MKIPDFKTKKELFAFLIEEKETLIADKMAAVKHADGMAYKDGAIYGQATKAFTQTVKALGDDGTLTVTAIINTTNLMDSHKDVHLPGIWNKSIKENKSIMHLQEHQMQFDKIIAKGKDLKVSAKTFTWKELGFNFSGSTEALTFESTVRDDRNKQMFDLYRKGEVDNHSVGMRYVKLILAVNDEEYGAEYDAWEKYYPEIANKAEADAVGYFWAVKEAKVIEGSAVPLGSNYATPTLDIKEPGQPTPKPEPSKDTQKKQTFINLLKS